MSGAHIVENTNNEKIEKTNIPNPTASTPPPNNEELLKLVGDLADRLKKLEDLKLEDFEPLRKLSHFIGSFFPLGKSSNDTQENPKDAQKKEEELKKVQEVQEENAKLNRDKTDLTRERDNLNDQLNASQKQVQALEQSQQVLKNEKAELSKEKENLTNQLNASQKQVQALEQSQQVLKNEKADLTNENTKLKAENTGLTNKNAELQRQVKDLQDSKQALKNEKAELSKEKENLTNQLNASQKQVQALEQSQQVLKNENADLTSKNAELNNKITGLSTEKDNLTKDKENLTTALSTAKSQAEQTSQKLNELEQKHAPYQKLEKLYEVFLEVKDRLNFNFVATTHSAMDLIASVLSDSKYYVESLYNKASQELSDKRSDKGEKLAELFDLLFEYIKDSKFERLKEPSAYDYSCKTLYLEQNSSQKMQRVVLRGYKHNDKVYHTIVDMGS